MILWIIGAYESAATFIGILGVLLFLSGIGAALMVYDLRTLAGQIQYLRRIRLVLTKNVRKCFLFITFPRFSSFQKIWKINFIW